MTNYSHCQGFAQDTSHFRVTSMGRSRVAWAARFPKWHKASHPPTHMESIPNNGSQPVDESQVCVVGKLKHLIVVPVLSSADGEARGWSPPAKRSINFVRERADHPLGENDSLFHGFHN